jgi:EmrB/QacA subfamily drug resistance transporter
MLPFGTLTQIRGYLFSYRFGYIAFMLGSLICALSHSIELLIVGRVVQATGTAMFAAVGPGMVTTVFPKEERGKGIGLMVMMVSAGFMVGPPLGGFLLKFWPWQSLFLINLPIGLFGLYMVARYFPLLPHPTVNRKLPLFGAISIAVALVALVFGLNSLHDHSLTSPLIWGTALVSAAGFAAFIYAETRHDNVLIGLSLFRNRQFAGAIASQSAHFVASSGPFVLIPFYLENVRHLQPSQVGMYLVIVPISMFALAPIAGRLSDKIGFRILTIFGMLGLAAGLFMMSRLDVDSPLSYLAWSLMVTGAGVGLFSTPNSSAMMGAVRDDQRAISSSILATNRNIGISVGVALATGLFTFFQSRYQSLGDAQAIFVRAYRPVAYVGVAIALIGLIFCLLRSDRQSG